MILKGTSRHAGVRDRAASEILVAPPISAIVGFDGFVDVIADVVSRRHSMRMEDYERVADISSLASRIGAAAGRSTNMEIVVREERYGGNGPLCAGALAALGAGVTCIGAVGEGENEAGQVHPLYRGFAARCTRVIPLCEPSRTICLEFGDGKVMLNECAGVQKVTWDLLVRRVGLDALRGIVGASDLIVMVNWSLLGGVEGIWEGLLRDVLPGMGMREADRAKRIFIDLSDPAKRTDSDVARMLDLLARINGYLPVTLGLNESESERIARVLGSAAPSGGHPEQLLARASTIRERAGVSCVVIHPREGAVASDATSGTWFDGPFTPSPRLSTGGGDHFNAGFALAQASGMGMEECLALACATSGAYVRDAESPNRMRVVEMLRAF